MSRLAKVYWRLHMVYLGENYPFPSTAGVSHCLLFGHLMNPSYLILVVSVRAPGLESVMLLV
jgi:hypothetical protein